MIQAVLSNSQHPEYGAATIPFPIPKEQYDQVIEMLRGLEIGDERNRDCKVDELRCAAWLILKRLEKVAVNVDELDYLAKRLDSFDVGEATQFQAARLRPAEKPLGDAELLLGSWRRIRRKLAELRLYRGNRRLPLLPALQPRAGRLQRLSHRL
jgi:hypothetical protein